MDKDLHQIAKAPMIALIEKKNNLKTKTKHTAALLLMLALLAPLATWAQSRDCNGPITITADAPYIEDFESPQGTTWNEAGPLPDCWDAYTTSDVVLPHNTTGNAFSGSQSLSFYDVFSLVQGVYAILPEFSNPIGELQVSFYLRSETASGSSFFSLGQLSLGYITAEDDGTCNTFTVIESFSKSDSWVKHTKILYTVPATAERLVFMFFGLDLILHIDDLEVSLCECFPVGSLSVNDVTVNSASLSWELVDESQTEWNVQVATDANFTENLANYEADIHENFLIDGLSGSTTYYMRVKPACDEDLWSNAITFWTLDSCDGPITVTPETPYTQGFESPIGSYYVNEPGPLPSCWEAYTTGTVPPHNTNSNYSHNSAQSLSFNYGGNYALLPEFSNPLNELQISFWMISVLYHNTPLVLGYITDNDDGTCNTFTAIAEYDYIVSVHEHVNYITYLPNVPDTARRLVFKSSDENNLCYIDDVEVSLAPDCYHVEALSLGEVYGTSAYLSWELIDNRQTAWDVQVSTDAAFTDTIAEYVADSHENYLLSGLSGGTHYYVRVRANCDDTHQSEWSNAIDFTTPCELIEITAETPYLESFESPEGTLWTQHGLLPPCWEGYNNSSYPTPHNTIGSYGAPHIIHSGAQCLSFCNEDGDSYAILPEFSNPISDLQINFWMATNGNTTDKLRLGYLTTEDDGTCNTFTEIASYDSNSGSMVQRSKTLENVPAEAYRLAFKWSTSYYYLCFIDDVEVSLNPSMIPPRDIAATNLTPHTADITWEGLCDSYALRHREIPTLLKEGFEGGTMPEGWTIEGDNQDPTKTWRVGVGDHSNGTGTHSGNYNALITQNARNQVTYLVTPALDLGGYGSAELSFWYVNRKWSNRTDEFAVCYRIGSEGGWTELWSTAENHESWTSQTVALTGLGDNCQIGFRYTDHYGWGVGLDDIVLCDPTHFEWIAVGEAESPHTLTGLTTETTYEVQVKSNCAGYEDWSESVVFTTLEACPVPFNVAASGITATSAAVSWTGFNDSYNLSYRRAPIAETPLNEGFEGDTIPQGWTIEGDNQDPAKTWRIGVGDNNSETGTHSGNYNALITHNTMNQVTYLVTPALDLGEYGSMELSFWYINRKWVNDIDEFAVCYRIGSEGGWNELWSTAENHDTWTSQTIALTGLADNYQIGFRCTDHFGYGVGLDDIVLFDMTHSNWITLSEAENPHTLTGLMPETEYEVKVQGVCDGEPTDWSESAYFTTLEGSIFTKDIAGYGNSNGGWHLIASPVVEAVAPTAQNGFITNAFDLYRFNQSEAQGLEWENWKAAENYHFPIENGRGYLYASQENTTLLFAGTPYAATGLVEVPLAYDPAASFAGWNLVGNPFAQAAYPDRDFYVMNTEGDEIQAAESNYVEPMEGIFVVATGEGETMTFSATAPIQAKGRIVLNVTSDNRGPVIDRAIVRFGQGDRLPKFMLNQDNTKLYIEKDGGDYAVVRGGTYEKLPVNFEAAEKGTYTLTVSPRDMLVPFLQLIDKQTGVTVNLLRTPSYTFDAAPDDRPDRFELAFRTTKLQFKEVTTVFGFNNNGRWVISNEGDAILQVVDVNGRILSSEEIHGDCTKQIKAAPGVYLLRLINGEDVKVQKIVVE